LCKIWKALFFSRLIFVLISFRRQFIEDRLEFIVTSLASIYILKNERSCPDLWQFRSQILERVDFSHFNSLRIHSTVYCVNFSHQATLLNIAFKPVLWHTVFTLLIHWRHILKISLDRSLNLKVFFWQIKFHFMSYVISFELRRRISTSQIKITRKFHLAKP